MNRTKWLQASRQTRFEEVYERWSAKGLTQKEAARLLGISERTFRRYINRYDEEGLDGLQDKRLNQVSHRKAPLHEVARLESLYKAGYDGWNVKHFYQHYRQVYHGQRSYTWVKNQLQRSGLVSKGKPKGIYRTGRERSALPGMLVHQGALTHEWVPNKRWDLIVMLDDATNEIYSGFFAEVADILSSFRGVSETIKQQGIFSSFYFDRDTHFWPNAEPGSKKEMSARSQFGRAMKRLGIQMITADFPAGQSLVERVLKTFRYRLPKELALQRIDEMSTANRFLAERFLPAINAQFKIPAREPGCAFVPLLDTRLDDILCIQSECTLNFDDSELFNNRFSQLPTANIVAGLSNGSVRMKVYPNRD